MFYFWFKKYIPVVTENFHIILLDNNILQSQTFHLKIDYTVVKLDEDETGAAKPYQDIKNHFSRKQYSAI